MHQSPRRFARTRLTTPAMRAWWILLAFVLHTSTLFASGAPTTAEQISVGAQQSAALQSRRGLTASLRTGAVINRDWAAVASSQDGVRLVAGDANGTVYISINSGLTWVSRHLKDARFISGLTSSSDGKTLSAIAGNDIGLGVISTSRDGGRTWIPNGRYQDWLGMASSRDGAKLVIVPYSDKIRVSRNFGVFWSAHGSVDDWSAVASSGDGTRLVAASNFGNIYTSYDSGYTWVPRDSTRYWVALGSSRSGNKLVAAEYEGLLYTSTDSGVTWVPRDKARSWNAVVSSSDGTVLLASVNGGRLFTSSSSGATWVARDSNRQWVAVATSDTGSKMVAVVSGGQIFTSINYGVTWMPRNV